jgi:quinohemoprotein amine dehydrogenase
MIPLSARLTSFVTGLAGIAALLLAVPSLRAAEPPRGAADLLATRCTSCHRSLPDGRLNRIDQERKTPEAWSMTITRMERLHGLRLDDAERRAIVKYLSDTHGLAPQETRGFRYALERRSNVVESGHDEELMVVCARCHSYARVALQRRDVEEWRKLSHFHQGQFPTAEYHSRARDRDWWDIASTKVPARLAELYPFSTPTWDAWQGRAHSDLSGSWRVVGHRPGQGGYEGQAEIARTGEDEYSVKMELRYGGGKAASGEGTAIVYTGYEWRASLDLGGEKVQQVLALSEDGDELTGLWFPLDSDSLGADLRAVRMGVSPPHVLSVEPSYLKAGSEAEVSIYGIGLEGEVNLGNGVEVVSRQATPQAVVVLARAGKDAEPGGREVTVGTAKASGLFTVYHKIEALRVEPGYAIARVGGGGGKRPPVPVQFEAVAYLAGADGKGGTEDDVRVGVVPARWSVADFNEAAEQMKDTKFAGTLTQNGLFMPSKAGPNPKRPFHTNNAGDLWVRASAAEGTQRVDGSAHLVVTVQRWVDPPVK